LIVNLRSDDSDYITTKLTSTILDVNRDETDKIENCM
jgi:hypothetical protein